MLFIKVISKVLKNVLTTLNALRILRDLLTRTVFTVECSLRDYLESFTGISWFYSFDLGDFTWSPCSVLKRSKYINNIFTLSVFALGVSLQQFGLTTVGCESSPSNSTWKKQIPPQTSLWESSPLSVGLEQIGLTTPACVRMSSLGGYWRCVNSCVSINLVQVWRRGGGGGQSFKPNGFHLFSLPWKKKKKAAKVGLRAKRLAGRFAWPGCGKVKACCQDQREEAKAKAAPKASQAHEKKKPKKGKVRQGERKTCTRKRVSQRRSW